MTLGWHQLSGGGENHGCDDIAVVLELLHLDGDENSKSVPGEGWHSDVSCNDRPPAVSMLRIETTPSVGGDTAFSHQAALYESFSDTLKNFLRSLKVPP
jgi:taurine dioxygenase